MASRLAWAGVQAGLYRCSEREAVPVMTCESPEQPPERDAAVQTRRWGAGPVQSIDDLARPDLFESDEELAGFLAMVYADRRAGLA